MKYIVLHENGLLLKGHGRVAAVDLVVVVDGILVDGHGKGFGVSDGRDQGTDDGAGDGGALEKVVVKRT